MSGMYSMRGGRVLPSMHIRKAGAHLSAPVALMLCGPHKRPGTVPCYGSYRTECRKGCSIPSTVRYGWISTVRQYGAGDISLSLSTFCVPHKSETLASSLSRLNFESPASPRGNPQIVWRPRVAKVWSGENWLHMRRKIRKFLQPYLSLALTASFRMD